MEKSQRSSRKFYTGLALIAVLVAVVALPAPAAHLSCGVSDDTPAPGETIFVRGGGWAPTSLVRIWYDDANQQTLIGEARVDRDERLLTQVMIPADAEPGTAAIIVRGRDAHAGNEASCKVIIRVVPPEPV